MDFDTLVLILGVVMPFVVSMAKRQSWSKDVRFLVMIGVSVVFGFGAAIAQGEWSWTWAGLSTAVENVTVLVTEATVIYKLILERFPLFAKPAE